MLHVNAIDYFLEAPGRTWDQFLEFFDDLCERQGTELWAKAQTDPHMLERMRSLTAEQIAELQADRDEPHRQYTPLVRELRNVCDQIIALRAQMGRVSPSEMSFMPRPRLLGDEVSERQSELSRAELDEIIAEAHASFERHNQY